MEMEYCGPQGIPHSEFLGWKEDDQDKAIAWLVKTREKCPECGSVTEEWLDEDGRLLEDPPWEAKTRRCMGCAVLHDTQEEIPDSDRHSVRAYLERVRRR